MPAKQPWNICVKLFKNRLWTALCRLYWEYHAHWWPRPDSTNNLTSRIRGLGGWNTKSLPCDWLERVIHFPTLQSGLFVDSGVEVAKAAPVNCSAVEICKIFHFAKIWVASHESQSYLNVSLVAELAAGTPDKCDPDIKYVTSDLMILKYYSDVIMGTMAS